MKIAVKVVILLFCNSFSIAQQRQSGIKVLVKDKETGYPFTNDSMMVVINDTLVRNYKSDKDGYGFFNLAPGRYSLGIIHVGYQRAQVSGIIVGEAKTAYLTLELYNGEGEKEETKNKKGGVKLKMLKN
jgi:hypothetical protein